MKASDKEILSIALPSILANITVPLVGIVDIAVAGHLASEAAILIGGISIGTMLFNVLYWNFGFLRIGTGGLTAQAYGREDWQESGNFLFQGIFLALASSLLILLLQLPFIKLSFLLIDCSDEVRRLAMEYFFIRVWASPATLCLMTFKGWFIGMQDSVSAMATDLTVNTVNILASIFLSTGIPGTGWNGMGFAGIAWGTVAAQYSGLALAAAIMFIKYRKSIVSRLSFTSLAQRIRNGELRRFMSVNAVLFLRSICLTVIYIGTTVISASFGDLQLASCSILMQLMMIFSYFTDGFAFAGEALSGKYFGRKDKVSLKNAVRRTFLWSMGIGMFFIGIYIIGGLPALNLMTSDKTVAEYSRQFLPWLILMPVAGCPAFTWDGIYAGITAARQLSLSALGSVASFFIVWTAGMLVSGQSGSIQVHILMAAYFSHLLFRSVYQTVKYKSLIKAIAD